MSADKMPYHIERHEGLKKRQFQFQVPENTVSIPQSARSPRSVSDQYVIDIQISVLTAPTSCRARLSDNSEHIESFLSAGARAR